MRKDYIFKSILGFAGLSLAVCAAFFSIKGIALLFSASFWSVAIMAASLELAKLVSASYLYRSWKNINIFLKRYMLIAVVLLMAITSLGIFGFLSDAFQKNFSQYSLNISKIQALRSQQAFIVSQVDFNKGKLKDLIDLQKTYQDSLDSAVKQDVTTTKTSGGGLFGGQKTEKVTDNKLLESRNKIVEGSQQNINSLFNQIQIVTSELQNLEKEATKIAQDVMILEADNTKGEIGTFKFVAEAFGMEIETAVKIFIILLVIVFDPLAVCLIIAFNSLNRRSIDSFELRQPPAASADNIINERLDIKKDNEPKKLSPNDSVGKSYHVKTNSKKNNDMNIYHESGYLNEKPYIHSTDKSNRKMARGNLVYRSR